MFENKINVSKNTICTQRIFCNFLTGFKYESILKLPAGRGIWGAQF